METLNEYYDRHRKALDPVTASYFNRPGLSQDDMVNFINGIDLMEEITRTVHFKTGRYLETPDSYVCRAEINRVFNQRGGSANKIKKVGYPTNELITELLEVGYLGLFYRVMHTAQENRLSLKLDNKVTVLKLDPHAPHRLYGIFEYTNVAEKKVLKLPFFLNRLGRDHLAIKAAS